MQKKVRLAALMFGGLFSVGLVGAVEAPVEAQQPSAYVASSIQQWTSLRGTATAPFESYASFILAHRGWPGETDLRRKAERQVSIGVTGIGDVVRFFTALPPLTAQGHAAFALALQASGQTARAAEVARTAWAAGSMPSEYEQRLLSAFGGQLGPQDHDRRVDALLDGGDAAGARRAMSFASPQRRPLYGARLALQARSPDAQALVANVGTAGSRDPGLLYDRLSYLNRSGNPGGARQLAAQRRSLERQPANPERFMELMVQLARGAATDGQARTAYEIASQIDDLYPAGVDLSTKSFGERDEYTNLAWLAGTTALQNGRAADAIGMFDRYGRAAASPQTRAKGLYWAGRAAGEAGQAQQSRNYLTQAARNYDQYYGQLAADRLGQALAVPPAEYRPTAADRQAFERKSLVAAIRYLSGNYSQQTTFLHALADDVNSDAERALAAELGRQIGRRDLAVLVSRQARREGASDVHKWGFPTVNVPPAHRAIWPVANGITRQESLFDVQAQSPVGARGLMQLMPGTARQVSGQMGMPYAQGRLTSDPDYNVMLGSYYFQTLLDQWGGSYPLAVASYNAGPGNVRRWISQNGDPRGGGVDMVEWIERIPFTETRGYVQRVLENTVVYDLLYPEYARSPGTGKLSYYLGIRR